MAEKPPFPLLILSDAPSASSGLGRICRDLATRIHERMGDVCRVATLGYGGPGSSKFGFVNYVIEGMSDWVVPTLPEVWEDFAGEQKGAILSIWDISRLAWYAQPERSAQLAAEPVLRNWLTKAPFKRFGYFPIDAEGPNGKLSFPLRQTLLGFDRVLAYGSWAKDLIERSIGEEEADLRHLDYLPHGIDTSVFYERDRAQCRLKFGSITGARLLINTPQLSSIMDSEVLVGIVATNQARKDWALAAEIVAILSHVHKIRLWIHTDTLERNWSIPALLADYSLLDKTMISLGYLSDDSMAQAYSACDVTLGVGAGEGMGYPLLESLACGTPVIHGNYAGGAEVVPYEMRVEPIAYHAEGLYACARPVFKASDWVDRALQFAGQRAHLDPQYDWNNLWPRWQTWLQKGIAA